MTRTAAEVEQEVVAQRDQLDRTVEALKDKMSPGQLFDEASRAMGGAGQQVFAKFVEQAQENPMPLAVMGLGLAWLMSSSRGGGVPRGYAPAAAAYQQTDAGSDDRTASGDGLSERMHDLGDKASHLASGAAHKARDAATSAAHAVSDVAGGIGGAGQSAASSLRSAADTAGDYGRRAQQGIMDLVQKEPLLLGAVGLFVGLAVGAALPATEAEDRLVGPMRDDALEKGKTFAHDALAQAGEAAHAAVDAVTSELGSADIAGTVRNVSHAGVEAVRETLRDGA